MILTDWLKARLSSVWASIKSNSAACEANDHIMASIRSDKWHNTAVVYCVGLTDTKPGFASHVRLQKEIKNYFFGDYLFQQISGKNSERN